MSNTVINSSDEESSKSSKTLYKGTAYGIVPEIKEDLDIYGLDSGMVSFDIEIESSEDSLDVEYQVETLEWYEDDGELGLGKEPVSFNNSYSIETNVRVPEDGIVSILEDNFDSSPIRANGEVVRESLSPDYDTF